MGNVLNCSSCGGTNQLPEGKNSMFCAFCGNAIEKKQLHHAPNEESLIKSKPKIINERLTLTNRKINSLLQVTSWFSDDELKKIKKLDLSSNNISSLDGIESYRKLKELDLSNNKFSEISADDIERINNVGLGDSYDGFRLVLFRNPISSDSWVSKIDVTRILNTYTGSLSFHHKTYEPYYIPNYKYVQLNILSDNGSISENHPNSYIQKKEKPYGNPQIVLVFLAFILLGVLGVIFSEKEFGASVISVLVGVIGLIVYVKNVKFNL
ncbi:MAG: hypothetical protein ACI93P_001684 [bacterium]|jgi:hypothetical protein